VLSAVLLSSDKFDEVASVLSAEHFYSDANKRIFDSVRLLLERGSPVDNVTVASFLKSEGKLEAVGGTPYLATLTDAIPAVVNLSAYALIVREKWQARRLIQECQRWAAEAYVSAEPAGLLVQSAEASLAELSSLNVGKELEHVGPIIAREANTLEALRALGETGNGTGLSTGFTALDRLTSGLQKGDSTIVAGRPAMGKTAFVMNIVANIARPPSRLAAAVFSLEMPKAQVAVRLVCSEQQIEVGNVRKNTLNQTDYPKFVEGAKELAGFGIWIDDTPSIGLFDIRARVRKLQRDLRARRIAGFDELGVVVIDYVQLMRGIRERGDSREAEVSGLSRGLKALAKDFDLPVVALSQLNRNPERQGKTDKRPQLSDLRESGALEQDADNVIFLYRPDYYDREARKGDAEVIVAKQRNGPPGTVQMFFRASSVRFLERAEQSYDDLTDEFAEDV
jgi:replicative DNA helicase